VEDLQQVILDELRATRGDLHDHIRLVDGKFTEVRRDITELQTNAALMRQRANTINAVVAMITSAIVAWFVSVFGQRG